MCEHALPILVPILSRSIHFVWLVAEYEVESVGVIRGVVGHEAHIVVCREGQEPEWALDECMHGVPW